MSVEGNKSVVERWYRDMWNRWEFPLAEAIVHPDFRFRGSLGWSMSGVAALVEYMREVRRAFPDFHNEIEQLVAEGDTVVARRTYSGTHKGPMFGIPGTGRKISYAGVAIFTVEDGRIATGWVLGDVHGLRAQLERR